MAKKLYVGNLSYNMTEDDLRETFGKLGEVLSAKIIMDNETGRSKGFGFVEMSSEEEAQKAISLFNGKEVDGRELRVNVARPREESPTGDDRRRSYSNDYSPQPKSNRSNY